MPDNYRGVGNSTRRINRTQRSPGAEGYSTGGDADEVARCIRAAERKAYRKAVAQQPPPLPPQFFVDRLPNPIIRDLSVDDVCREMLYLADLLAMDNVYIS
jgi:hypothetical protein